MNAIPQPEADQPKESEKFKAAMKQILSVPKAEIDRRDAEYRKQRGREDAPKKINTAK